MERGIPMMKKLLLTLILSLVLLTLSVPTIAETGGDLVIVTSNESQISSLSRKELRRIYLGLEVIRNDNNVKPIRNYSSETLHEVFLQKIMFMSSRTYERQLNLRTIRKGVKPPEQFSSHKGVINALVTHVGSIAYMRRSEIDGNSEIRVVPVH